MKKKINDIRIRTSPKNWKEKTSIYSLSGSSDKYSSFKKEETKTNLEELASLDRRNFLKIVVASGGVLLTGGLMSKINKFSNIPSFINSSGSNSLFSSMPPIPDIVKQEGLEDDYESFFKNFSIVKNKKEYILYNKEGEDILIIDRDI